MGSLAFFIGLISFLNRADELVCAQLPSGIDHDVDSLLALPVVTPRIPATKALVCPALVPMRIVPDSPETPAWLISMLLLPVILKPAWNPIAVLLLQQYVMLQTLLQSSRVMMRFRLTSLALLLLC